MAFATIWILPGRNSWPISLFLDSTLDQGDRPLAGACHRHSSHTIYRSGECHALDFDLSGGLRVRGLPVAAQSDDTSRHDHHCGTGVQPATLHQLHRSGNGRRPAKAGRRGVVPAARWELADHPDYAGIAATGLRSSPTDPISLWLPVF